MAKMCPEDEILSFNIKLRRENTNNALSFGLLFMEVQK